MADVFISYTRDERQAASTFKRALERLGVSVFFDIEGGIEAGEEFPQAIKGAVDEAKAVLACWSPSALARPWVRRESMMAQDRDKLVPVAIAPIAPSDLPAQFYEVSFVDLSDFDGEHGHRGWAQVLDALAAKFETHARGADVVRQVRALRAAAQVARDTDVRPERVVSNASRTGALWEQVKTSADPAELRRFADAFPGTTEGYQARARADVLDAEAAAQAAQARALEHERAQGERAKLRRKSGCGAILTGSALVLGGLIAIAVLWGFLAQLG